MKKIDMFVFISNIVSVIAIIILTLVSIIMRNSNFVKFGELINTIVGIMIFVRFLKDDNYKFKYYLGYIFSNIFIGVIFKETIRVFSVDFVSVLATMLIGGIVTSYISAFLFQFFKEKSYLKNNKLYQE